jgi:polyisoprenoid-binding protein YceI
MTEAAVVARQVQGRTVPAAGTWAVDPAHSSFEFVARHLVARVRGRFTEFTATVEIAEDPTRSSVEIELDVSTVTTGDDRRDAHLRSPDFFDVEKYPKITFRSTAVRPLADESRWELEGELTILGVTRPVTFELEFHGAAQDPWGGLRAGFSAWTEVNREDWGLSWNTPLETGGFLLSKNVRLEVDVELVKQ